MSFDLWLKLKIKLSGYCGKSQRGKHCLNHRRSHWKNDVINQEWNFIKKPNDLPFNQFINCDNKTIFKIWNNSLSKVILSSNQNCNIYWTLQTFWRERWRDRQKWLLPLNINITIFKTELLSSIAWIDANLPICCGISKPPKFNTNFCSRILLADAHSRHIFSLYWSQIHIISESYRNGFLNLSEMRTWRRKENPTGYW